MQVPPIMTDFMNFKDEILKKVRLLETKLINEINSNYNKLNTKYEKIENKMSFVAENTDSLLEFITTQKLNIDKISELESSKNKTEQNIKIFDMKLKNILAEIDKIKSKYDKIFKENMQVPGYIGQGCQYKSIPEYIQNNILDFAKLKNEKDQMKIENIEVKNRLDNILKSTMSLIESSILRCQNYSDNRHEDMKNILNNKLIEIKEKNMDLRAHISKNELKTEKQIQNLKNDFDNLSLIKIDLVNLKEQKIEEINNKIKELNDEIVRLGEKIKENEENLKSYKNKENSNLIINSPKKINYKLQNINPIKVNNNYEQLNSQINKNIDELQIKKKRKEERKTNLSEENNSQNFEKIMPKKVSNLDEFQSSKEEINEYKKIPEDKNPKVKEMNEFSNPQQLTSSKNEEININQNHNINNNNELNIAINNNYKNPILKVPDYLKNKRKMSNEKIKIESLDKKIKSNSLQNIYEYENKKTGKKININLISKTGKIFTKINIKNKENTNKKDKYTTRTPRVNIALENNKKNIYIKKDKKQKKIMDEIKTFYNNKKEKSEQKSRENVVDCNVINLHLEKPSKRRYLNSSAKNLRYSKDYKIKNNLNEIGMKINPVFGRTTYRFYHRKEINGLTIFSDNNRFEKSKLDNLKDKINIALVSYNNKKSI